MYKKLIIVTISCFLLTGCSALKILTAPFKPIRSTAPQQIEKSKQVLRCKGEIEIDKDGRIISCSEKFYSYEQNFERRDKKLSFRERIGQWIMTGAGWVVWAVILSVVATMFGFGWVVSMFWNAVFGLGRVLRQTMQGIKKFRQTVAVDKKEELDNFLRASQDKNTKTFVAKERTKI